MNSALSVVSGILLMMLAGPSPAYTQSFGNLDTKFVFRLLLFSEGDRLGLSADVSSSATYPCAGFGIKLTQFTSADTITIHIGGLIRPNPCFQASDIATSKLFVGPLMAGRYVLNISYRGVNDLYLLDVHKGRYAITQLKSEFTEVERL